MLSFDKIGSLVRHADAKGWNMPHRPLTMNMNELIQLGNFPAKMLPQAPFATASSYYQSLAETQFMHLATQRNDAVDSEEDCRAKYISRNLFCKLTEESRLRNNTMPDDVLFKLFCDDLRPTEILLNADMKIVAVIDWEFAYTVPAEFACAPPWWSLLEIPEEWPREISDWIEAYGPRLETFLRVLQCREDAGLANGELIEGQRISEKMRASWEHGDFWVKFGARKKGAFGDVWPMIAGMLFGGVTSLHSEERLELLRDEDRKAMGTFLQKKLEDRKEWKLDDWDV